MCVNDLVWTHVGPSPGNREGLRVPGVLSALLGQAIGRQLEFAQTRNEVQLLSNYLLDSAGKILKSSNASLNATGGRVLTASILPTSLLASLSISGGSSTINLETGAYVCAAGGCMDTIGGAMGPGGAIGGVIGATGGAMGGAIGATGGANPPQSCSHGRGSRRIWVW